MRRASGFTQYGPGGHTLMEILVVLAVLGVMAGAVAPALMSSRDEDGVAGTSGALVELLLRSRAAAAERGVMVSLVIDPRSGRAWTRAGDDAAFTEDPARPLARLLAGARAGRAPVAIITAGPRAQWDFTPSGMAFGDAILVRDATHGVIVQVDRWTGAPRVAAH